MPAIEDDAVDSSAEFLCKRGVEAPAPEEDAVDRKRTFGRGTVVFQLQLLQVAAPLQPFQHFSATSEKMERIILHQSYFQQELLYGKGFALYLMLFETAVNRFARHFRI